MVRIRLFAAAFNSFSTNSLRVSFGWVFESSCPCVEPSRSLSLLNVSFVFILSSFSWFGLGIAVAAAITAEVLFSGSWYFVVTLPCVEFSASFPLFKPPHALLSSSISFEQGILGIAAVLSKTPLLVCCFLEVIPPCFESLFSFFFFMLG